MEDVTLVQISKNLSDAMSILGDTHREVQTDTDKPHLGLTPIPGPLQGDGLDVSTIVHRLHSLVSENKEGEEQLCQHRGPSPRTVTPQGQVALLAHSLVAYVSSLDRECVLRLSTRTCSDCTLWICRLFRYDNASVCFHDDDREGLVKVCRLLLNARYEDFACEGYAALAPCQPVIYQSASCRPGLGQHACSQLGLPLSSLCTVPCNTVFGSQHQMDVALLDKLIQEDSEAGRRPLLLIANAGTPGAGHTDKLGRLRELCDQHGMWLHVEGVNLATLVLEDVSSAVMAATRSDSMTLTPGRWLGLPAVPPVTLYRHEDPALSLAAGLTSSQPTEKLRALPLWLCLQHLGQQAVVHKISHAVSLSKHLLQELQPLASIRTLVEDDLNSPVVLFRFSQDAAAAPGSSPEVLCAGEKEVLHSFSRWLGEQLGLLVSSCGLDVVELEDEGPCVRFSPLLTAAVLGTQQEDVDQLVEQLKVLVPVLSSTLCLRSLFREETHRRAPLLTYHEEACWPGLGAVRYEPQMDTMEESRRQQEVQKVHSALLKKLQELDTDVTFCTGPEVGGQQHCIYVGLVTEDVDVSELVDTIAAFGREVEENGRLLENMTEVVRKGILEAELQLQKDSQDKLLEEGVLRQLPVLGSVLNWFSPVQSSIKGRTFNLAAGSLDSTDGTYLTKAQEDSLSTPDTPTSSSKRSPGHRFFHRSSTTSSSSTDGVEDSNPSLLSSSSPPDTPATTSDTSQPTVSDVIAEEGQGEEQEEGAGQEEVEVQKQEEVGQEEGVEPKEGEAKSRANADEVASVLI